MVNGLRVTDATITYLDADNSRATAVRSLSVAVEPGQVLGILGASGSGKSTLLRGIAGLEPLDTGSVSWDGADLAATPVHKRGFALMFQDGQLFPHRTVAENIGYPLRKRDPARVADLLDLVGLPGFGPRRVTSLSGGEQQRVALARALAAQPKLLLLDEPLSALDRELRERLATDLRDILTATGTTAIFVTHDQAEAFAIADRVAIMDAGEIVQLGSPQEVWRRPATTRIARFLGYTSILDAAQAERLGLDGPSALRPTALIASETGVPITIVRSVQGLDGDRITVRIEGVGDLEAIGTADATHVRLDRHGIAPLS
jgi:thiamine transport system ATP-binding protein